MCFCIDFTLLCVYYFYDNLNTFFFRRKITYQQLTFRQLLDDYCCYPFDHYYNDVKKYCRCCRYKLCYCSQRSLMTGAADFDSIVETRNFPDCCTSVCVCIEKREEKMRKILLVSYYLLREFTVHTRRDIYDMCGVLYLYNIRRLIWTEHWNKLAFYIHILHDTTHVVM